MRRTASVWSRLDLDPVPLAEVARESSSSSVADWEWTPGLRESPQLLYRPQAERLGRRLGSRRVVVDEWRGHRWPPSVA